MTTRERERERKRAKKEIRANKQKNEKVYWISKGIHETAKGLCEGKLQSSLSQIRTLKINYNCVPNDNYNELKYKLLNRKPFHQS